MSAPRSRLQNIVLPAGDQKIGPIDFMVVTNATPLKIEEFNNLPIKQVGNATVVSARCRLCASPAGRRSRTS